MAYFGLALHTPEFGSNIYLVFAISGLMDAPNLLLSPILMTKLGRRCLMTLSLSLAAVMLLATSVVPKGRLYYSIL